MSGVRPKALVLTGYGINCDYESARACELAGFESVRIHINDVIESVGSINEYRLIVAPGGFSFGDDLGAGVAFSAKLRFFVSDDKKRLIDMLAEYAQKGGLILGVCNGFQILVRLGMIPAINGRYGEQQVTLALNREGYFIDRWVHLKVEKDSYNVFTRGLNSLRLPVRHGEGRMCAPVKTLGEVENQRLVSLRYSDSHQNPTMDFPENPNGSEHAIAGLCDPTGRIFGLMPHPEAAVSLYQYPDWTRKVVSKETPRDEGDGYRIFKNAFENVR